MEISIITIMDPVNYGAVLQSYALYKYLSEINDDEVNIINYTPNYKKKSVLIVCKELVQLLLLRQRINKSNIFKQKNIKFTDRIYKNIEELKTNPPSSEIFIVGSDQVWNSDISNGLDPAYFLSFVKTARKISYASSIGKENVSDNDVNTMKEYLIGFDAISVREVAAKSLLEERGLDVQQVLDPVFLLDKLTYQNLLVPYKHGKYLLIYGFDFNKKANDIIRTVAKEKNLMIIEIGGARKKYNSDKFLRYLSPLEFLGVLNGAEYVVTSSFHGTAFSILFNKNFVSILPSERGNRIESILNLMGLEERLIKSDSVINIDELLKEPNYLEVNKSLNKEIKKSKAFLAHAICK